MSGNNGRNDDWRQSIAQTFRSDEVRSIAKVLASLEPGATSASKTMLAMRFEESIFKAASSLDDYRKTMQKRLKKLQKHYAKEQKGVKKEDSAESLALFESELRDKYGAKLLYIAEHADRAVALTRETSGDKKADILRLHATNVKQWAVQLGLKLPENCLPSSTEKSFVQQRQDKGDMAFLKKIESYLISRLENIRSHIVKIADLDLYLKEALVKLDDVLLKERLSMMFEDKLKEWDPDQTQFTEEQMKRLVDRMNDPVPIPRRNQEGDRVRAAVARLEKLRAAAQALYVYMGLPLLHKTRFRGAVEKSHGVVMECLKELEDECDSLVRELGDKGEKGERVIQLEDAWNTPLQITESESDEIPSAGEEPDAKRQKTENFLDGREIMVIRSRYLLTPGRNTFSSLLPALKRKKATLVRHRSAPYVRLEFGKAFEMTIYFVPLLVTVRAMATEAPDDASSSFSLAGGLRWPSLYQGLCPLEKEPATSDGSATSKHNTLTVLGVTGSFASVGPIIAKKLEFASAQATHVLRRCFADATLGKTAKTEFEIEIQEVGALIRFLQIARSTYISGWVDDDA